MGKRGRRCVYKGNADGALTIVHPGQGRTLSLPNPGAAFPCRGRVFCIRRSPRARSEEENGRRARVERTHRAVPRYSARWEGGAGNLKSLILGSTTVRSEACISSERLTRALRLFDERASLARDLERD